MPSLPHLHLLRRPLLTIASLSLGLVSVAYTQPPEKNATHEQTVTINKFEFTPSTLTVHVGDTVVWLNKDIVPHTVSAPGDFDSGTFGPGKTWKLVTKKTGTFQYDCTLHPNMKGTLIVEK
jgi:plastocyanin